MRPLDRIPSLFVRKQSLLIFNNAASGRRTPHIGIADGRGWAAGTQCATHRAHGHAAETGGRARGGGKRGIGNAYPYASSREPERRAVPVCAPRRKINTHRRGAPGPGARTTHARVTQRLWTMECNKMKKFYRDMISRNTPGTRHTPSRVTASAAQRGTSPCPPAPSRASR